jgi:hypothetical protein
MKFQTRLVLRKRNIKALIFDAGAVMYFGCAVLLRVIHPNRYTGLALLVSFIVFIVGAILTRKKNRLYTEVADIDLTVTSEGIRIGDQYYPMDQVQYLDFLVEGHDRMLGPRFTWQRPNRMNGMGNRLFFDADGKKHTYGFYLEDPISLRELSFLFREFYQNRQFFRERNSGGRTFLFQRVANRKELEVAKQAEGYA